MPAYYNEHDPKAAAWLRELIADGHIAAGDVDERSIADVQPSDISSYTQVHFFAGIGGWSYAARLAGWPDDRPLWTGSCPCQPFSGAGKRQGTSDPRHLWPEFARLIRECRPATVIGEQVASKDGRLWLAGVRSDLEELGYGVGAADLCAAGVGAPHIRQRLWWLADAHREGQPGRTVDGEMAGLRSCRDRQPSGHPGRVAEAGPPGRRALQRTTGEDERPSIEPDGHSDVDRSEHPASDGRKQRRPEPGERSLVGRRGESGTGVAQPGRLGDSDRPGSQGWGERLVECPYQWPPGATNLAVLCTDGKARRFEPGSFPLAHGVPGRVGLLRGYGNAIVPAVAAEFIRAYLDVIEERR